MSSDTTSLEFYSPWPKFGGRGLSKQWNEIRQNQKSLHPMTRAAGLDPTFTDRSGAAVQAWEVGEQDFHNKFRIYWDKNFTEFKIQYNNGTTGCPIWSTYLQIDAETGDVVITEGSLRLDGGFYGDISAALARVAEFGVGSTQEFYNVKELLVNFGDGLYLTADSAGNPIINLADSVGGGGLSNVNITTTDLDGAFTPTNFATDTLTFNRTDFYLTPDSAGKPIVSLDESPFIVPDGSRAFTGPVRIPDGSASAPSIAFTNNPDLGIYGESSNSFIFVTIDGSVEFRFGANQNRSFAPFQSTDGVSTAPSLSFTTDTNTGVFKAGDDALGIAAGGTELIRATQQDAGIDFVNTEDRLGVNLGVGTEPSAILEVAGDVFASDKVVAEAFYTIDFGELALKSDLPIDVTTTDLGGSFTPTNFSADKVTFNRSDFYLTPDSAGEPIVNLSERSSGDAIQTGIATQSFTSSVEWEFNHGLGESPVLWHTFDDGLESIIPDKADVSNTGTTFFYFSEATSGTAIVSTGRVSTEITFTDGVNSHKSNILHVSATDFYISTNLQGEPVLNLR